MRSSILAIVLAVVFPMKCAIAQSPFDFGKWIDSLDFKELKQRALQRDTTLDFTELRFAYTKTRGYDPYGKKLEQYRDKMNRALDEGNFENCLKNAHKIIDKDITNLRAHISAAISGDSTGLPNVAEFHRWMWTNLVQSILSFGDGKTPQTAYVVTSIDEEYGVMQVQGLRVLLQSLGSDSTGTYDLLVAVDGERPQDTVSVYFNINLPWAKLMRADPWRRF